MFLSREIGESTPLLLVKDCVFPLTMDVSCLPLDTCIYVIDDGLGLGPLYVIK